MKKLLLVFPYFSPDPGAASARGESFAKYLQDSFEIQVITKNNHKFPNYHDLENVKRLDLITSIFPWYIYQTYQKLRDEISNINPDIILASAPNFLLAAVTTYIANQQKIPVIADLRDQAFTGSIIKQTIYKTIFRYLVNKANKVFVTTEEQKHQLSEKFSLNNSKVVVVSNGVDLDLYPEELPQFQDREVDLLFLGSINPERNIPELTKFIKKITEINLKVKVRFVGVDLKSPSAVDFVNSLKDLNNIEFIGEVDHTEAKNQTTLAKFGVVSISPNPVLEYMLPVKVFEYMAGGCVVVGIFEGSSKALQNIFTRYNIGVWDSSGEQLAYKLNDILKSPAELTKVSTANQKNVKVFSRKAIVDSIKDEIDRLS